MGASVKTLIRLMELTEEGRLPVGADICDIGTSQISGPSAVEVARAFLKYYDERRTSGASNMSDERLSELCRGGLVGELLVEAGFTYVALDIFEAEHTIVFDLNRNSPGPDLVGKFDLVTNFGTTEHVFNQVESFRTIHDLLKPTGVAYHDLPFAGYLYHGLFRYDSLFFDALTAANKYTLVRKLISVGNPVSPPTELVAIGLEDVPVKDVGIEVIVQKTSNENFCVPLEMSTSIAPFMQSKVDGKNVVMAVGQVNYSITHDTLGGFVLKVLQRLLSIWRGRHRT